MRKMHGRSQCKGSSSWPRFLINTRPDAVRRCASSPFLACVASFVSMPVDAQSIEQACSAEIERFPAPPFEAFDANRDGFIEQREASRCRSLNIVFVELDLNNDEKLTPAEYDSFAAVWSERARSFGVGR